jgi:hypothetical protein
MKQRSIFSPLLPDAIDNNEQEEFYFEYTQESTNTENKGLYNIPLSYLCTVNSKVNNTSLFSLLRMAINK